MGFRASTQDDHGSQDPCPERGPGASGPVGTGGTIKFCLPPPERHESRYSVWAPKGRTREVRGRQSNPRGAPRETEESDLRLHCPSQALAQRTHRPALRADGGRHGAAAALCLADCTVTRQESSSAPTTTCAADRCPARQSAPQSADSRPASPHPGVPKAQRLAIAGPAPSG